MTLKTYLTKHFKYNPITGIISRTDRKNSTGSFDKDGYLIIKIKGKQYKSHRLAWFLYHGEWPKDEIDHINRIRIDNRIVNLRNATRTINNNNTSKHPNKDTGEIGIYIDKTKGLKKKYAFRNNKKMFRYYTLTEAIAAKKLINYEKNRTSK